MKHRKNFLPCAIFALVITDGCLAIRCMRNRMEMASAEVKPDSAMFSILKAAYNNEPLPKKDIAKRHDWHPEDFFDQPLMVQASQAILNGDQAALQTAIANGLDLNVEGRYGFTLLFWAFACNDLNAFEILLAHGADPDKQLKRGVATGDEGFLYTNDSVLMSSTRRRKHEFLLAGLKCTTNPNQKEITGQTLLNLVLECFWSEPILIKAVIDAGGDVNIPTKYGSSPLLDELIGDGFPAVLVMLEAGADPMKCRGGLPVFKRVLDRKFDEAKERKSEPQLEQLEAIMRLVEKFSESDRD